ncbi:MFS transporter, partial [Agrobacterium sp.]
MSSQISLSSPTPTSETDPRIWAVLAVAVGTQTAGSFVSQGIYILVPFWREAFGVSLASASLAVTVMNGVQIATMFMLGRAIDIHGERRIVGIAMLGMAIAMACAAAFADSLPALLVCIAFLGGTYAAV